MKIPPIFIENHIIFAKNLNFSNFFINFFKNLSPLSAHHALGNDTEEPLVVIEVQMGSYFGEDDIVRVSDPYHR